MNDFEPPFRVGRKRKRAVLDANGIEVVVFREGLEDYAKDYAGFLNVKYWSLTDALNRDSLAEVWKDEPEGVWESYLKQQVTNAPSNPKPRDAF